MAQFHVWIGGPHGVPGTGREWIGLVGTPVSQIAEVAGLPSIHVAWVRGTETGAAHSRSSSG